MTDRSTRNALALAGASVIVTRPAATAAALVRGARVRGAHVVRLPGMRLCAIDEPAVAQARLDQARKADTWIFTSPTAVLFGLSLLGLEGIPKNVRMCAVGAGTARALARNGIESIAPAHLHNSQGLLDEPALAHVDGRHIVLVEAPGGRDLLDHTLSNRGARIERIAVYRRVPPNLSSRYLNALRSAERPWITLLSSSLALSNLLDALPADLSVRWRKEALVVSSGRLMEQARERGFTDVHEAGSALPRDLLSSACSVLGRHRL
ncbi:uroporphyrinogen-III synthase [Dokdonella sp.]|uniref:uroporphyrinogen-III synthase n=1 Tax=Dokdonella sp. TaxID=2291710 RepID=UPI003C541C74